jgi:hypothetical protein
MLKGKKTRGHKKQEVVQSLCTDGKGPSGYIADTTTANRQVSTRITDSPWC